MSRSPFRSRASQMRRRRMTLALQLGDSPDSPAMAIESCEPDSIETASNPLDLHPYQTPVESFGELQDYLSSQKSVTWLLTGDSLAADAFEGGAHLAQFLPGLIRSQERHHDVFIVTDRQNDCLENLARDLDSRVIRFAPQVVILTIGPKEFVASQTSGPTFESLFHSTVQRMRDRGITVIIHLPPCFSRRTESIAVDEQIRLEEIRNCTKESGALLIDQCSTWETEYKTDSNTPNRPPLADREILDIAKQMLHKMGLSRKSSVAIADLGAEEAPIR